jgi:lysophospholipase
MLAVEREPGELVIAVNSTIWEFSLGEFGSWSWGSDNKTMGAFTDIQYLGTGLDNAQPTAGCVLGFSNLG